MEWDLLVLAAVATSAAAWVRWEGLWVSGGVMVELFWILRWWFGGELLMGLKVMVEGVGFG